VLVGMSVESGKPIGMQYRGSLLIGMLFADMTESFDLKDTVLLGSMNGEDTYSGSAIAMEISGELGYGFTDMFSAYLTLGYHLAKVDKMKATKATSTGGAKGAAFGDSNGDALVFDFSGIQFGLGARLAF